jgi:hypothetical protein
MHPKKDSEFNATLRRLIKQKPKPQEEMKKGREPAKKAKDPDVSPPRRK